MAKAKVEYGCTECGDTTPKWTGKCPSCGAWNTLVEHRVTKKSEQQKGARSSSRSKAVVLGEIQSEPNNRISTGIGELNNVLGGGIVPGSVVLVGGDPGVGKSTLMLQVCTGVGCSATLYVSGEESAAQIRDRALRIDEELDAMPVLTETNVEWVLEEMEARAPKLVVIDSIQTMYKSDIDSAPGSVTQVRECTAHIIKEAKRLGISVFLVGHVTKDGSIAGPRVLEHMVDAVLQFEGDRGHELRVLRAVKNRFGSTNELAVFVMKHTGMEEVPNPSALFIRKNREDETGTVIAATLEGNRPLLVEVQALVSETSYGNPQRVCSGFDSKRLQLLLAVLEKRMGMQLGQHDVFINIAGGIKIQDTALDFAVIVAIVSSYRDITVSSVLAFAGEIGLGGEFRMVPGIDQRVREALRFGLEQIWVPTLPESMRKDLENSGNNIGGSSVVEVDRLVAAIVKLFA